jgi:hypothetical protein
LEDAKRIVGEFIEEYNGKRLHSAIGWITPNDKMAGKAEEIWQARDEKLEVARKWRAVGKKMRLEKDEQTSPRSEQKELGLSK